MKNRLYYENSMTKEFTSIIEKIDHDDLGTYIVLQNTAFYPTGGGQPHDTGTIGGIEIVNVEEIDGEIRHYVIEDAKITPHKNPIDCQLNWQRRFDHMQQHAGQHILTAAFVELFDFSTLSFHLGTDTVTIDLDTTTVTEAQLAAVEARANEIILENREILTSWTTVEEANKLPLRKALKVTGDVRLVIIPNFDYNGCGGTHPTSTGQVQAIKILSIEKMKQNIRVHFVCGNRVLQTLHTQNTVLTAVAKQLSAPKEQANEALQKLITTTKMTEKALTEAQDELIKYEADALSLEVENNLLIKILSNKSMQQLQKMAKLLTANASLQVALVSESDDKYQIVVARGTEQAISMKTVIQKILPALEGKGGGGDQLAQGGGSKTIDSNELTKLIEQAFI